MTVLLVVTAANQQPALISVIILSLEKMVKVLSLRLGVEGPLATLISLWTLLRMGWGRCLAGPSGATVTLKWVQTLTWWIV